MLERKSMKFSKANLKAFMQNRIDRIQEEYQFDLNNGTAQIKTNDRDAYMRISIAYGSLRTFLALLEDIDNGLYEYAEVVE